MQVAENPEKTGTDTPPVAESAMPPVTAEDQIRAQIYRLLAGFLSQPPGKNQLETAANLTGDDGEFGEAISNFAKLAAHSESGIVDREYHDLFIGVTRGELLPYGSYYLTGFLNEKPLATLRADMASKGIERVAGLKEPEDHIASVLEMMAGLIEGAYGQQSSLAEQKIFFDKHVKPWVPHFFKDLEAAKNSVFYAPFGTIGRLFMNIEQDAFEMV